ncbi:MAG: hypothetical protein ACYTGZ_20160 [Planctomycetota bacterium]
MGPYADAHIDTRADRARLARLLRTFRPLARKIAVFGGKNEKLRGFTLVPCKAPEDAKGLDAAWITEDAQLDPRALRKRLDALRIPLVSTSPWVAEELPAVSLRPDPRGLGLQMASQILEFARTKRAFRSVRIDRHRVVVNLDAAKASGVRVPLALLARADVVKRAQ